MAPDGARGPQSASAGRRRAAGRAAPTPAGIVHPQRGRALWSFTATHARSGAACRRRTREGAAFRHFDPVHMCATGTRRSGRPPAGAVASQALRLLPLEDAYAVTRSTPPTSELARPHSLRDQKQLPAEGDLATSRPSLKPEIASPRAPTSERPRAYPPPHAIGTRRAEPKVSHQRSTLVDGAKRERMRSRTRPPLQPQPSRHQRRGAPQRREHASWYACRGCFCWPAWRQHRHVRGRRPRGQPFQLPNSTRHAVRRLRRIRCPPLTAHWLRARPSAAHFSRRRIWIEHARMLRTLPKHGHEEAGRIIVGGSKRMQRSRCSSSTPPSSPPLHRLIPPLPRSPPSRKTAAATSSGRGEERLICGHPSQNRCCTLFHEPWNCPRCHTCQLCGPGGA